MVCHRFYAIFLRCSYSCKYYFNTQWSTPMILVRLPSFARFCRMPTMKRTTFRSAEVLKKLGSVGIRSGWTKHIATCKPAHVLTTKQGRIGVGAFRTTLKIGSYTTGLWLVQRNSIHFVQLLILFSCRQLTDNRGDKQPDFLLNLPGECSEDLVPSQTRPKPRKEPRQNAPQARSRLSHANRKRERRAGHQTQQISRKRSSKSGVWSFVYRNLYGHVK